MGLLDEIEAMAPRLRRVALALTEQALVIERGAAAWAGASGDLVKDQALIDRYIGLNLTGQAKAG